MTGLDMWRAQMIPSRNFRPRPASSSGATPKISGENVEVGGAANKAAAIIDAARAAIDRDLPRSDTYPTAVVAEMQRACSDAVGAVSRVVAYLKTSTSRELDDAAKEAFAQWSSMVDDAIGALPHKDYAAILLAARQTKNPTVRFPDDRYKLQVLGCLDIVRALLTDLYQSELAVEINERDLAPLRAAGDAVARGLGLLKRAGRGILGAGQAAGGWLWSLVKGPAFWILLALIGGVLVVKYVL